MSDIKLNLEWDISPAGEFEFMVSPVGGPVLATLTLKEDDIAEAISDDLEFYDADPDPEVLKDWEALSNHLRYLSDNIDRLLEDARIRVAYRTF